MAVSASGATPGTVHIARAARTRGAEILAVTGDPTSELGRLADRTLSVPRPASRQFGGSLFEQTTLILLDALILHLTMGEPGSHDRMARQHANLE